MSSDKILGIEGSSPSPESPHRDPWYPGGQRDAMVWVAEFNRLFPDRRPDNDTMLGWFANAIETGVVVGERSMREVIDQAGTGRPWLPSRWAAFAYGLAIGGWAVFFLFVLIVTESYR